MKLGALLDQLRSAGLAIDEGPVVLSVARDLKILRLAGRSGREFLRILERSKGERDFANLRFLEKRLGGRINGPAQVLASDDLTCGVFPFVAHHKVSYRRMAAGNLLREVATTLALMHEAGGEYCRSGAAASDAAGVTARTTGTEGEPATGAWLESRLRQLAERHPPAAQHCDFTYANLGVAADDRLVVFDWEQFGQVTLPGFDLTTFLLGHCHFGGDIGELLDSPVSLLAKVRRVLGEEFLGRIGLTADDYVESFPAHLLLFWSLKGKGFSVAINRRMQAMWERLRRASGWSRHIATDVDR